MYAMNTSDTGKWRRFGPDDPCPCCGSGDRNCDLTPDGLFLCLGNVPTHLRPGMVERGLRYHGQAKKDPQWAQYVAVGDARPRARRIRHPRAPSDGKPTPPPQHGGLSDAEARDRHEAYRAILDEMSLTASHRANLRERGLSDDEIKARGFRSLPDFPGRCSVARAVVSRIGKSAFQVPGIRLFRSKKRAGETYPCLYGLADSTGIVIPVVNRHGLVVALRTRIDPHPGEALKNKYRWFRFSGDAKPATFVHYGWPWAAAKEPDRPIPKVIVTEGELKAGITAFRTGIVTLSIPGVDLWRRVEPELEYLKARGLETVMLALDHDAKPKPAVFGAARHLYDLASGMGLGVTAVYWGAPSHG